MGVAQSTLEDVEVTDAAAFQGAYRGARVLVTGHTGFKGSWLAICLELLGAEVSGLALEPEGGDRSLFVRSGLAGRIDSVIGDVRDPDTVDKTIAGGGAEIVFHLAAQPLPVARHDAPL